MDVPAWRRRVVEDEYRHHGLNAPPEVPDDLRGDSRLDVEPPDRVLRIADRGFDLDNRESARRRVMGQNVDAAAVAVVVEADLDAHDPAQLLEEDHEPILKRRVAGIEEPGQALTLPVDVHPQISAQRFDARLDLPCRHVVDEVSLDARYQFTLEDIQGVAMAG